jgi:hypothetical protein
LIIWLLPVVVVEKILVPVALEGLELQPDIL